MYRGYDTRCSRMVHRPGSFLYGSVANQRQTQFNMLKELGPLLPERPYEAHHPPEEGSRYFPDPARSSLSYRFNNIELSDPNSFPEYHAKKTGGSTRYLTGQQKAGVPQGCTSCISAPHDDHQPGQANHVENKPKRDNNEKKLFPILDPKFNLREVAKHMILLEDHLFQKGRRCDDCINKHWLTLEAFLEEAITLDQKGEYRELVNDTLYKLKDIMQNFVLKVRKQQVRDMDTVYCNTAQQLRLLRKPLCMAYSDFC